jgi:HAE1 family hydrophobic/amphiphilic exporter-1
MTYQEKQVGSEIFVIFGLSIMLVFLVLAAQYESWSSPAAVILSVPLALSGTVIALNMRGFDNNVYTQIGIVLLVALASKNAILIVEFAREGRASGLGIVEAAIQSARLRFRPILMTALSFIFGTIPLVIAAGAAAASRQALGTAVFGGMIAATILGVLFVPVFFVVCQSLGEGLRPLDSKEKKGGPTPASDKGTTPLLEQGSSLETTLDMKIPPLDPPQRAFNDGLADDDDEYIDLPDKPS